VVLLGRPPLPAQGGAPAGPSRRLAPSRSLTPSPPLPTPPRAQPPLVATHPQSGNRTLASHLPGLGRALDTETLAEIRRSWGQAPPAAASAAAAAEAAAEGGDGSAASAAAAAAARLRRRPTLRALRAQRLVFPRATVADPAAAVFAVLAVAGKQYKVSPGDVINAERLKHLAVGEALSLPAMVVGTRDATLLGRPTVPGAAVRLRVREHVQDLKVTIFKKKRRKRYQKKQGHRREVTRLEVEAVDCRMEEY
jgi:large subunit ribosomal protein L21